MRDVKAQANHLADSIIYDWNSVEKVAPLTTKKIEFVDETLRDGIQNPSVVDPPIGDKIRLVHLMDELGITVADIGLPAAGPRACEDVESLARSIFEGKLRITACCAARTVARDIVPIVEIAQKVGLPIEVYTFIGSSPIRAYAEDWDLERMLRTSAEAIDFAVKEGMCVAFVTEDTTRAHPYTLDKLFRHAIDHGVSRLCLCDTVGHATPDGVRNLMAFTKDLIKATGEDIKIDWHGHNDRGLSVTLSLHAIEFGADRVHGCAVGVGERVGNTPLDQVLVNLKLLGAIDNDLSKLQLYCTTASESLKFPIPWNYPVVGRDAFRTGTGVHAAAIIKAEQKGDAWLADRVYSGVPAGMIGRRQVIEIGPMSGLSNVNYWLRSRGLDEDGAGEGGLADFIFRRAKQSNRLLTDDEVFDLIATWRRQARAPGG
jgi:2-isopropylmalate synthase